MNSVTFAFIKVFLLVIALLFFGYIVMYNRKIVDKMVKSEVFASGLFYKLVGRHLYGLNQRVTRTANLNRQSVYYKWYKYFDDMILNLDLAKDGVTVVGLVTFMLSMSLGVAVVFGFLFNMFLLLPISTGVVFYLIVVIFRLMSLIKYERREADIMDAVDLLVSDIKGGVYNAIVRYQNSFNPNIREYFLEFVDDVQNKGFNFKQAMLILNGKLGHNFTDFAHKAILYEGKADKDMSEIFSSIIETNRQRRTLRHVNAIAFNKLRTDLIICLVLIFGYVIFAISMDSYLFDLVAHNMYGKIMVIGDIGAIAWVLMYITSIKSESL